ncbi:ribosomal protein S18-alanine N-acetyltransferase [candidate division KSB1 bacterium]|nr:ribosomal protein S18-alanine N-acetyltransferase [candidate division KSB1 bacterium]
MMPKLILPLIFKTEKGDVLFELMTMADIVDVHELEVITFKSPASLNSFKKLLENPDTINLVAKKETEVVAYLTAQRVLDEVHIFNMTVIPAYRRLGIAERLLDILFNAAQDKAGKEVYLEVRISNLPAISLYQKAGFTRLGIRKGYYHDNQEDAMVMVRYL